MNRDEFYHYYDIGAITDPAELSQRYFTIIESNHLLLHIAR